MKMLSFGRLALLVILLAPQISARAKTLHFSGLTWEVRPNEVGGPGPRNHWSEDNAWVDASGHLHLRLAPRDGIWFCPEVYTRKKFGFGKYRFVVEGRVDRLDKNVVLGLFDYPDAGQGPDGTHELDIEFARWGRSGNPIGNYTVFPPVVGRESVTRGFPFHLSRPLSVNTITRRADSIDFESRADSSHGRVLGRWNYAPADPTVTVTRLPLPVHMNLWLFERPVPSDDQPVEIIIRSFQFFPG